jgi:hypothetical protein
MYGVSAAAALSAAFLFFLINNVSISLIGIVYLFNVEISAREAGIDTALSHNQTPVSKIR